MTNRSTNLGLARAGLRRTTSGCMALAALAVIAGCSTSPAITEAAKPGETLYDGEPSVLHATEMPVASAEEARARAVEALAKGDTDLALYLYVQAANLDPEDSESLFAIGRIHSQRGNAELAARAFARVIELNPAHAAAQEGLGLAYFDARQFADAEPYLIRAVELEASLWRSHNALGVMADMDEAYGSAIAHYSAAIDRQPRLAWLRNNRGYSRYLAGDLEAAKRDFLAALEIDGEYKRAWRNLGLVLARQRDYDRALNAMSVGIERHAALNDIGYIAMLDGDYQTAQSFFEDAIMASPRYYQTAHDNLAELTRRRSSRLATAD